MRRLGAAELWWAREILRFSGFAKDQMHQLSDDALRQVEDAAYGIFMDAAATRQERNDA